MLGNGTLHERGDSNNMDAIVTNVNVVTHVSRHIKNAQLHDAILAYDSPQGRLGVIVSSYIFLNVAFQCMLLLDDVEKLLIRIVNISWIFKEMARKFMGVKGARITCSFGN